MTGQRIQATDKEGSTNTYYAEFGGSRTEPGDDPYASITVHRYHTYETVSPTGPLEERLDGGLQQVGDDSHRVATMMVQTAQRVPSFLRGRAQYRHCGRELSSLVRVAVLVVVPVAVPVFGLSLPLDQGRQCTRLHVLELLDQP